MRKILFILFFAFTAAGSSAQTASDSIKATISKLFDGMKNADATLLKSAFADSAVLQTINRDKQGNTVIGTESIGEFAGFVSKQVKGDADERISYDVIRVDANLAIAWTPYKFYYKGKFSHCGVNSFQLVRFNGEWKIQYLIDTRRKAGCE